MKLSAAEYLREWKRRNPDRIAAYRAREVKNPETIKRAKAKFRVRHRERLLVEDAEEHRRSRLEKPHLYAQAKVRMQLSYAKKREIEAGKPRSPACEICHTVGKVVFDHCHVAGHFRGWICDRCNKVLGLVYESTELLDHLKGYLDKQNGKTHIQSSRETAR